MKELLCQAFCDGLDIRPVPAGYALRTPYMTADGDALLIYLVRTADNRWRLEDDGTQVPMLEANGVDLSRGTRAAAFHALLSEYAAEFDAEERTIRSQPMTEVDAGAAALGFMALLLRLQDLALLTAPVVRSAFREDAVAAIHLAFEGQAEVEDKAALADEVVGTTGDVIVRPPGKPSLAIFIGTSEERALSALVMKMDAEKYVGIPAFVALLVERSKKNPIAERTLGLAWSRLDRVLSFRGMELVTMNSLVRLVGLKPASERLQ